MDNTEKVFNFIILIIGMMLGAAITFSHTSTIIDECEAELPRNQHCKLIAVPEPPQEDEK